MNPLCFLASPYKLKNKVAQVTQVAQSVINVFIISLIKARDFFEKSRAFCIKSRTPLTGF